MPEILGGHVKVDIDISDIVAPERHGVSTKSLVVLHETVSPDYKGSSELVSVSGYMARNGLGIHGVIDGEGYLGWAVDLERAIFYHAASGLGMVNTRAIGIELVSRVMLDYPDRQRRFEWWWSRHRQIEKTAQVLAYLSEKHGIPLVYSEAGYEERGITTHWQVSQTWNVPGGHVDCYPRHLGGYFPVNRIIWRARQLKKKWYGVEAHLAF